MDTDDGVVWRASAKWIDPGPVYRHLLYPWVIRDKLTVLRRLAVLWECRVKNPQISAMSASPPRLSGELAYCWPDVWCLTTSSCRLEVAPDRQRSLFHWVSLCALAVPSAPCIGWVMHSALGLSWAAGLGIGLGPAVAVGVGAIFQWRLRSVEIAAGSYFRFGFTPGKFECPRAGIVVDSSNVIEWRVVSGSRVGREQRVFDEISELHLVIRDGPNALAIAIVGSLGRNGMTRTAEMVQRITGISVAQIPT